MRKGQRLQSSVGHPGPRLGARAKKDAKSLAREEEKENIGVQSTASRHRRRSGVLGATATLGVSSIVAKSINKGSGKRKPSRVKEKKLPLQDITSKFLPEPEFANRGVGSESGGPDLPIHEPPYQTTNTPLRSNLWTSPLPPSSPPADLVLSPVKSSHLGSNVLDGGDDHGDDHIPLLPDGEYNAEHDQQTSSSSDPFGFAALEKKLKEERIFVTNMLHARLDVDDDIYEELHDIPVADTSSPRPIRRIKQSLTPEGKHLPSEYENQDEAVEGAPGLLAHPWFFTPPTPHKHVKRRLSCEGQDVFNPCSSSLQSSPSPTKTSASKRRREIPYGQDPLEEFNTTIDETGGDGVYTDKPPSKRKCQDLQKQAEEHQNTTTWNLRPRRATTTQRAETLPKPPKNVSKAKSSRKAKSNSIKIPDGFDDDDLEEKLRQDREERIKYFERLSEYSVEKENVYII